MEDGGVGRTWLPLSMGNSVVRAARAAVMLDFGLLTKAAMAVGGRG